MEKYDELKKKIENRILDIEEMSKIPVRKELLTKIKNVNMKIILGSLKYFSRGKHMFLKTLSEVISEEISFLSEEEWDEVDQFLYDKIDSLTEREIYYGLFDSEKLIPPWDRIRYTVKSSDKKLLSQDELKKLCENSKELLRLKVRTLHKKEKSDDILIAEKLLEMKVLNPDPVYHNAYSYQAQDIIEESENEDIKNVVKNWYKKNELTFATEVKNSKYHIPNLFSYVKKLEKYDYLIDENNIENVRENLYTLIEERLNENIVDPYYLQKVMEKYMMNS